MGQIQNAILQALGSIQHGIGTAKFIRSQDPEWKRQKGIEANEKQLKRNIEFREDSNKVDIYAGLEEANPTEEEITKAGKSKDLRVLNAQANDYRKLAYSYYSRNKEKEMISALKGMNSYYTAIEIEKQRRLEEEAKNASKQQGGKQ